MAKFIKLTPKDGPPCFMNTDHILCFVACTDGDDGSGVQLTISEKDAPAPKIFQVRETPEQILSLIEEATKP